MIEGSRDALSFTDGMDRDAFMAGLRTQRAVVMSPMIVGEAAARTLSEYSDFAEADPGIPWRGIRGMRGPHRAWLRRRRSRRRLEHGPVGTPRPRRALGK
jgi:uncharacterized protein with HEPN domain